MKGGGEGELVRRTQLTVVSYNMLADSLVSFEYIPYCKTWNQAAWRARPGRVLQKVSRPASCFLESSSACDYPFAQYPVQPSTRVTPLFPHSAVAVHVLVGRMLAFPSMVSGDCGCS